MGLKVIYLN